MIHERFGTYHKDRFKPKPWYEVALEGADGEAAFYRFQEAFGHRQWQFDPLGYLKWDVEQVLCFHDTSPVFEFAPVAELPWLWAFASRSLDTYRAPVPDLRATRDPKIDLEGWYFCPESFEWCLCGTWDFAYWICDPHGRFDDVRHLSSQSEDLMAGYSNTPLVKKLGIRPGFRIVVSGGPAGFLNTSDDLPENVTLAWRLQGSQPLDLAVVFVTRRSDLEKQFARAAERLSELPGAGIWIAWPKKSSGVATDITEDTLREVGLPSGLVDNKVCAIDETWSGLRFVHRRK